VRRLNASQALTSQGLVRACITQLDRRPARGQRVELFVVFLERGFLVSFDYGSRLPKPSASRHLADIEFGDARSGPQNTPSQLPKRRERLYGRGVPRAHCPVN